MIQIIGILICARIFLIAVDTARQELKPETPYRLFMAVALGVMSVGISLLGVLLLIIQELRMPHGPKF